MRAYEPEQLARMAWREELDDGQFHVGETDAQRQWYALPAVDRAGLLAEQEYAHTKAWLDENRQRDAEC